MGDWDDERGWRTSVLGRVDWACWLAVVGLLFVTVMSVVVQFVIAGVITAILAVLLVVFDSWVNRPGGRRARARYDESGQYTGAGWSDVRRAESRPQPALRGQRVPAAAQRQQPRPDLRGGQQGRPNQGQQPRPQAQPGRQFPGQQAPRPGQGQPPRPNQGGQPTRANQGQQPPFRPAQPPPTRHEPDYRART